MTDLKAGLEYKWIVTTRMFFNVPVTGHWYTSTFHIESISISTLITVFTVPVVQSSLKLWEKHICTLHMSFGRFLSEFFLNILIL